MQRNFENENKNSLDENAIILEELKAFLASREAETQPIPSHNLNTSVHASFAPLATPRVIDELSQSTVEKPVNGRIVTVFLCGTCSNSEDHNRYERFFNGEIVSHTYQIAYGEDLIDIMIVDGPGSGEKDAKRLWVSYKPYSDIMGQALGEGIEERLNHIMAVLKNTPDKDKVFTEAEQILREKLTKANEERPITQVNIIGWSRGAAAGITLANMMENDEKLNHIKTNLILVDPVPGGGLSNGFNRKVPASTENCYVIYAEDERSAFFNPVIPDCPPTCNYVPIVLPGGHAHVAGDEADHAGKKVEGADLRSVGIIARHMVEHIAQHLGTRFKPDQMSKLTLKELISHYESIKQNREAYRKAAQRVSYTIPQLVGRERKVIHGNDNYFNQYFSDVRAKCFPPHENTYLDYAHQRLETVTKLATHCVDAFYADLDKQYHSDKPILAKEFVSYFLKSIKEIEDSPLLCRAISEELQARIKPSDLENITLRCDTKVQLEAYIQQLMTGIVSQQTKRNTCAIVNEEIAAGLKTLTTISARLDSEIDSSQQETKKIIYYVTNEPRSYQTIQSAENTALVKLVQDKKADCGKQLSSLEYAFESLNARIAILNSDCETYANRKNAFETKINVEIDKLDKEYQFEEKQELLKRYSSELKTLDEEHQTLNQRKIDIQKQIDALNPLISDLKQQKQTIQSLNQRITTASNHLTTQTFSSQHVDKASETLTNELNELDSNFASMMTATQENYQCLVTLHKSDLALPKEDIALLLDKQGKRIEMIQENRKKIEIQTAEIANLKKATHETISKTNITIGIMQGNLSKSYVDLLNTLTAIEARIDQHLQNLVVLKMSIAPIASISNPCRNKIADFSNRNFAENETFISQKAALVKLLKTEHNRIADKERSGFTFNSDEKSITKLQAIKHAISLIELTKDKQQLAKLIHTSLLTDVNLIQGRRYFDTLLNRFSIFTKESTLKTALEAFVNEHQLYVNSLPILQKLD